MNYNMRQTSGGFEDEESYNYSYQSRESWDDDDNNPSNSNSFQNQYNQPRPFADNFQDEGTYEGNNLESYSYDEDRFVDDIFKDGRMEEDPKKKSKKKRIIVLVVSAVFLGGMAGLIYYLHQVISSGGKRNAIQGNKNDSTGTTPTGAPGVSPSNGIGFTPQMNNNNTNSGSPDGLLGTDSSLRATVPPPPDTLKAACSRENIALDQFNIFRCESSCREAACCYAKENESEITPCLETNEEECTLYSPQCDFLYGPLDFQRSSSTNTNSTNSTAKASTISQAPSNLSSLCNPVSGSSSDCFDACFEGYCCFSSAADILAGTNVTAPSCYDRDICEGYIPCLIGIVNVIIPDASSDEVPRPPVDLPELCSDESMESQNGAVSCVSHCSKAMCCIDMNPATSCIAENIGVCTAYSSCSRILHRNTVARPTEESNPGNMTTRDNSTGTTALNLGNSTGIVVPPTNLTTICAPGSVEASGESLKNCADVCETALCCFQQGDSSCLRDQLAVCLEYNPCQVLVGLIEVTGRDVPIPAINLEGACGDQSLSTQAGRSACVIGCFPGLCCTDPNDSCFDKNAFNCLKYEPCEAVVDLKSGGFDGIVPLLNVTAGNGTDINIPLAPLEIIDTCSTESLSTSQNGVADCYGLCAASVCCTSDDDNCYALNSAVCDSYGDCLNLLVLSTNPLASDNELPIPPDDLDLLCSIDRAFSRPDCRLRCEPAACCHASDDSSCFSEIADWCTLYSPCLILFTIDDDNVANSTWSNSTANVTALIRACSLIHEGGNPDECDDLCSEGACCFTDPNEDGMCANNTNFCDHYLPCSIRNEDNLGQAWNTTTNSTLMATLIFDRCTVDNMSDDSDSWEACAEVCLEGECCFGDSSDQENCLNRTDFCEAFNPCLVLLDIHSGNATISIADACHPDNVKWSNSTMDCEVLCFEASCCFLPKDDVDNCTNNTTFCEPFEVCDILLASSDTGVLSSESPSLSPSYFGDGNSLFEPSVSAYPTTQSSSGRTLSVIEQVCSETQIVKSDDERQACVDLCAEGACCFVDILIDFSCKKEVDFCEYYQPCSILFDSDPPSSSTDSLLPLVNTTDDIFDPAINAINIDLASNLTDALFNLTGDEIGATFNLTNDEVSALYNMTDLEILSILNATGITFGKVFDLLFDAVFENTFNFTDVDQSYVNTTDESSDMFDVNDSEIGIRFNLTSTEILALSNMTNDEILLFLNQTDNNLSIRTDGSSGMSSPSNASDLNATVTVTPGLILVDPPEVEPPSQQPQDLTIIEDPRDVVNTPIFTVDDCTQYDINADKFVKCLEMCDARACCYTTLDGVASGGCNTDDAALCPEVIALCNQLPIRGSSERRSLRDVHSRGQKISLQR